MSSSPKALSPLVSRRRALALSGVLLSAVVSGCSSAGESAGNKGNAAPNRSGSSSSPSPSPGSPAPSPSGSGSVPTSAEPTAVEIELPRGGRTVFPHYRLVGYVGAPGAPALGRLGIGDLDARVTELEKRAAAFADGREVMPVMELIATLVHGLPGRDGMYRSRFGDDVISTYLAAARKHKALLLLNIQPGRAHFIDEVKYFDKWLKEPDVGLALDPEWAVGPYGVPMKVFGHTTGAELDQVSRHVAAIVKAGKLPEKVIVYHQLNSRIVRDGSALRMHAGVVVIQSIDGIGARLDKEKTWRMLVKERPKGVHPGFKLFFEEDAAAGPLMTPAQVMALVPTPEYVVYE